MQHQITKSDQKGLADDICSITITYRGAAEHTTKTTTDNCSQPNYTLFVATQL